MGSFNTSGFISKLPINYGDKVVCLICIPSGKIHDFYESESLLGPICLPIYGKYNDYGSIYDIEKNNVTDFIEKFFGTTVENVCKGVLICQCESSNKLSKIISQFKESDYNKENLEYVEPLAKIYSSKYFNVFKYGSEREHNAPVLIYEHRKIYEMMSDSDNFNEDDNFNTDYKKYIDNYSICLSKIKELIDLYPDFDFSNMLFSIFDDNDFRNMYVSIVKDNVMEENNFSENEKKLIIDKLECIEKFLNENVVFINNSYCYTGLFHIMYSNVIECYNNTEEYFNMFESCKDELIKYMNFRRYCERLPVYFTYSQTGLQQQDNDKFLKLIDVEHDIITEKN
jgi:hypothetical protein